jgi:hypothetical protein
MNPIVGLPALHQKLSPAEFRAALRELAGGVSVIAVGQGRRSQG